MEMIRLQIVLLSIFSNLGFAVPSPSREQVDQVFAAKRIFLLVGINRFEGFRPLTYPVKDTQDLAEFLTTHNQSDRDIVITLHNEEATTQKILAALDGIESQNTKGTDTVIVYFSTHGTLAMSGHEMKRFIVTRDTQEQDIPRTGLSIQYLIDRLSHLTSQRKALILALCHSGAGKSQIPQVMLDDINQMKSPMIPKPLHEKSQATMILSASTWGQPAREDPQLENDIYTHFLLQGLNQNDINQDGAISLFEAHEYARNLTYNYTKGQQTPTALVNMQGADPLILKGAVRHQVKPMIFAENDYLRQLKLFVNGQLKGSLWQPLVATSGNVHVKLIDPQYPDTPVTNGTVHLKPNQSYSIKDIMDQKKQYSLGLSLQKLPIPGALVAVPEQQTVGMGPQLTLIWEDRIFQLDLYWQELVVAEVIASKWRFAVASLAVGNVQHFEQDWWWSYNLGIEALSIWKQSPESSTESIRFLYPKLALQLQRQHLFDAFYLRASLSFLPLPVVFQTDDRRIQLKPMAMSIGMGRAL